jgi:hypothetical protein
MPRWYGGDGGGGNDAFTKILLYCDGVNGGTSFPDTAKGQTPTHIWTAHGGAITTLTTQKFGPTSLFTFANAWIDTPDSPDFTLGLQDFSVDFWFKVAGGDSTNRILMAQGNSGGTDNSFYFALLTTNKIQCFLSTDGLSGVQILGTTAFPFSGTSWNHAAFVRKSGVIRLFVNGVQEGGDTAAAFSVHDSGSKFAIGRPGEENGLYFIGEIDEFRLSIGIARWFSNFTPPTRAYFPT